jgi:hypothetical protein
MSVWRSNGHFQSLKLGSGFIVLAEVCCWFKRRSFQWPLPEYYWIIYNGPDSPLLGFGALSHSNLETAHSEKIRAFLAQITSQLHFVHYRSCRMAKIKTYKLFGLSFQL